MALRIWVTSLIKGQRYPSRRGLASRRYVMNRSPVGGGWPVAIRRVPTMSFSLDAPQRTQIEQRRQHTRDYRLAMRLSALLWCDQGKTESAIAHLLGVCERTIRNWL